MQNALAKFRKTVAAVRAYLHPEAFEQRERDRQRAKAVETLETIQRTRAWCDGAEEYARGYLEGLNRAELGLDTPASSAVHHAAAFRRPPPERLPHGEYLQVPRTRREIYGHDAAIEADDGIDFARGARWLFVFTAGVVILGVWLTA